jgi:predicted  nucleic acid-binding Zn-ribbon protein
VNIKQPLSSENLKIISYTDIEKNKIDSIIEYGEKKIKQITRRISEKEVKLESMESHSDYEYNDLLREYNEAEKEHMMDLKLFVELFDKYKVIIK